jgi:hypothetical protein
MSIDTTSFGDYDSSVLTVGGSPPYGEFIFGPPQIYFDIQQRASCAEGNPLP